jgi:hypothetical protein
MPMALWQSQRQERVRWQTFDTDRGRSRDQLAFLIAT